VVRQLDDVRPDPGVSRIRESEQTVVRLADRATAIAAPPRHYVVHGENPDLGRMRQKE
jgi:hypothetical protein